MNELAELFHRHPYASLAGPHDNREILDFFDAAPLGGEGLKIRFVRSPDFFSFVRCRSEDGRVFLGRNGAGRLGAMGTLNLRPAYVNGELATVGYLGDLRVTPDRRLARGWREFYGDLLIEARNMADLGYCRHFLTSVMASNPAALAALVRNGRNPFSYRKVCDYQMVNVLGRLPSQRARVAGLELSVSTAADMDALTNFLDGENRLAALGFTRAEWPRRLSAWRGFGPESFVIARRGGRIAGCLAPWSPSHAKRIVIERLPPLTRLGFDVLRLARPNIPRQGGELEVSYLTHLQITHEEPIEERRRIFRAMLDFAIDEKLAGEASLLSFFDDLSAPLMPASMPYLLQRSEMALYLVTPRSGKDSADGELGRLPPGFEIALV